MILLDAQSIRKHYGPEPVLDGTKLKDVSGIHVLDADDVTVERFVVRGFARHGVMIGEPGRAAERHRRRLSCRQLGVLDLETEGQRLRPGGFDEARGGRRRVPARQRCLRQRRGRRRRRRRGLEGVVRTGSLELRGAVQRRGPAAG